MARSRGEDQTPDRLAAVLEELEAVRRAPGWTPAEDTVIDEPRSRMAELPRRVAATRRQEHPDRPSSAGRHVAGAAGDELRPREPLPRPPEPLIRSQVAPSRLAVIGALILVAVAGLVFGGRVIWARAMAQPHPVTPTSATAAATPSAASTTSAPAGFGAASASSSAPSTLVVQVVGQVRKPGVVQVKAGSRVEDAVAAAGGALPGADLAAINLARLVTDGEQIQVPKPGEQVTSAPQASAGTSGTGGTAAPAIVDLNAADAESLDTLPGVGPVMAQRILQWRADNGRFTSIDELGEVSGIGDKMLAQLRPLVRVG